MQTRIYSGSAHPCLRPFLLNLQLVRVPLGSSSNPSFFLLHLDFGSNGNFTIPSSYTHLKSFKLQSRASLFYTWISSFNGHFTNPLSYTHLKSFKLQSYDSLFYIWISSSNGHFTKPSSYTHLNFSHLSTIRNFLSSSQGR